MDPSCHARTNEPRRTRCYSCFVGTSGAGSSWYISSISSERVCRACYYYEKKHSAPRPPEMVDKLQLFRRQREERKKQMTMMARGTVESIKERGEMTEETPIRHVRNCFTGFAAVDVRLRFVSSEEFNYLVSIRKRGAHAWALSSSTKQYTTRMPSPLRTGRRPSVIHLETQAPGEVLRRHFDEMLDSRISDFRTSSQEARDVLDRASPLSLMTSSCENSNSSLAARKLLALSDSGGYRASGRIRERRLTLVNLMDPVTPLGSLAKPMGRNLGLQVKHFRYRRLSHQFSLPEKDRSII